MNPATAFATVFADELLRCGLREVVLAPGSRSAPLAMAFFALAQGHPAQGHPAQGHLAQANVARGRSADGKGLRLHVRIDERSAAFLALGLAKASRRPVAVLCTSGTAAASFHPAVIEADESGVPLLVLTADRPPELRGTGANQAIDQLKLYGSAVRWFCDAGVPEARAGLVGYWRSLACRAWAHAAGDTAGFAGPVHLNLPLREPLVPDVPDDEPGGARAGVPAGSSGDDSAAGRWPEPLDGRPDGAPWTTFALRAPLAPSALLTLSAPSDPLAPPDLLAPPAGTARAGSAASAPGGMVSLWQRIPSMDGVAATTTHGMLELPWTERGVVVCGDGDYDAGPLLELAEQAGWPVLAEPSSGARRGPNALRCYQYLLASPGFVAAHVPDVIVSAGRPGLSRGQLAFLRGAGAAAPRRHVVIAQGPGRWADPARTATDVVPAVRLGGAALSGAGLGGAGLGGAGLGGAGLGGAGLSGAGLGGAGLSGAGLSGAGLVGAAGPGAPGSGAPGSGAQGSGWLASWRRADAAASRVTDEILDGLDEPGEPGLARDLAAALPDGALLWVASSLPIRDVDQQMAPRDGLRVMASRGASGIDGLISTAMGAALAHAAIGGGPAFALLGDLAFLHDSAGLVLGPDEPRPDLCLVVVNNDGGGIFSTLEQAAFEAPFERVFGTPHGADLGSYARATGIEHVLLESTAQLRSALRLPGQPGSGLRIVEVRTSRGVQAALRSQIQEATLAALAGIDQARPGSGQR